MKKLNEVEDQITSLKDAIVDFKYQPELTKKLDHISPHTDFSQEILNEVVLWKVNRYASFDAIAIDAINSISHLNSLSEADTLENREVLRTLLSLHGISLPMASTILRFRNPEVFQIIDQRAYRILMPDSDKLTIYFSTSKDKLIDIYFDYLKALKIACEKYNIPYKLADRYLYQLDKKVNGEKAIH